MVTSTSFRLSVASVTDPASSPMARVGIICATPTTPTATGERGPLQPGQLGTGSGPGRNERQPGLEPGARPGRRVTRAGRRGHRAVGTDLPRLPEVSLAPPAPPATTTTWPE